ncbi:transcription elongation factor B polypeptide 3-like isoform X2 [Sinocyclocheilus anshuiensis]|uniref:transcription elongation factor B polypeptide 3-like isoform X2 n=1 Tax=Sinocyclocheilus anshuiensis TaxID=1608454 RepID=UPI0007B7AC90|nr:PREDICTED: transcription elongation factor B polypeptide 3-like isoform X2 [Sinocyclocheilus anshuiensis]
MAAADVKKVLLLKHQLKESCDGHTLLKILKKLEVLDITLEILTETGIGKVVNSIRKHDEAGKVAKILVNRWKTLVPKDSASSIGGKPDDCLIQNEMLHKEVQERSKHENSQFSETTNSRKKPKMENTSTEKKMSENVDIKCKIKPSKSKIDLKGEKKDEPKKDSSVNQGSWSHSSGHGKETTTGEHAKHESKKTAKVSGIRKKKENTKLEKSLKRPETTQKPREKSGDACKKEKTEKAKDKLVKMETVKQAEDGCETPSMSFEAYLNYDLEPPKRKKSFSVAKNPKRLKTAHKENSCVSLVKTSKAVTEDPMTTVPEQSVMDLLNVPLPTIFPECEDISQYQYFSEMKADRKIIDVCEEAPVFIGQRLNNKMQVYSGSKITYLPTMMTLYQQCIRTLQNNIDSLYEIGGVPFEILEPVLECCTPEQLLRIEEYNPVYIGATDHLWERHCQKDFRNSRLEEYESWREMYLRMSEERERKLKQLTKSIVSAHSKKPKGRQVKMAFIHSAAKPPRNVRIQQEIHGTAGPVTLPHPTVRPSSVKPSENRGRSGFSEPSKPSTNNSGQAQDPRKFKRVAPMMAKSLKAFKKQLSRR